MKNPELIEIAYNRLIEKGLIGIYSVYDIGNSIVAFGGNPNEKIYGCRSVEVNKVSGEVKMFSSLLQENEDLLDAASNNEIPDEYMYKKCYEN